MLQRVNVVRPLHLMLTLYGNRLSKKKKGYMLKRVTLITSAAKSQPKLNGNKINRMTGDDVAQ